MLGCTIILNDCCFNIIALTDSDIKKMRSGHPILYQLSKMGIKTDYWILIAAADCKSNTFLCPVLPSQLIPCKLTNKEIRIIYGTVGLLIHHEEIEIFLCAGKNDAEIKRKIEDLFGVHDKAPFN